MRESTTNAERWKHNVPCDDRPPLRAMICILMGAVAAVIGFAVLAAHAAHGAEPGRQLVILSAPGCIPCNQLQQAAEAGAFPGCTVVIVDSPNDPLSQEFARQFPAGNDQPAPEFAGTLTLRPPRMLYPALWMRGSSNFWLGYNPSLLSAVQNYVGQSGRPAGDWRRVPSPAPVETRTREETYPQPLPADELEGVHVVVAVGKLTETANDLRASVARRADQALQELVRTTVGTKVRATLIAEVADPDKFHAVAQATGITPQPVACYVLVPERFHGIKGLIVGRVEAALSEHYLVPLQRSGISVLFERIHGGMYEAVMDALAGETEPAPTPFAPSNEAQFIASAWISERLNLAKRLLARFGLARV